MRPLTLTRAARPDSVGACKAADGVGEARRPTVSARVTRPMMPVVLGDADGRHQRYGLMSCASAAAAPACVSAMASVVRYHVHAVVGHMASPTVAGVPLLMWVSSSVDRRSERRVSSATSASSMRS